MAIPDTNPNEYNDDAYLAASEQLRDALMESRGVQAAIDALWDAGSTRGDIESEWEAALPDLLEEVIGGSAETTERRQKKPKAAR